MDGTAAGEAMITRVDEDPSAKDSVKIEPDSGDCKSSENASPGESSLSKSQLKKIRKKQKWLERKDEKR